MKIDVIQPKAHEQINMIVQQLLDTALNVVVIEADTVSSNPHKFIIRVPIAVYPSSCKIHGRANALRFQIKNIHVKFKGKNIPCDITKSYLKNVGIIVPIAMCLHKPNFEINSIKVLATDKRNVYVFMYGDRYVGISKFKITSFGYDGGTKFYTDEQFEMLWYRKGIEHDGLIYCGDFTLAFKPYKKHSECLQVVESTIMDINDYFMLAERSGE